MNYIKKFFIVLGLAILSQIGMAVYGGAKGFSVLLQSLKIKYKVYNPSCS
ncbi:hypothetical protein LLT3_14885 [Lactococcus cremoris subsp. cremoris TIFN3]|uniref:Uncharacterized protein n=1 Tax=Lactococcus cremoris subsp. cremoris TIFN3 TaxID=1234873 RepID=T0WPF3_LACLC|nr:hypothetical protein LLT3_14885 [Lactococcus cremoris subsp. cremoris TIFN3]